MQMQGTYWLEKVLKTISLYVNVLLCTLQHIVIHAMQFSGVNSEYIYIYIHVRIHIHTHTHTQNHLYKHTKYTKILKNCRCTGLEIPLLYCAAVQSGNCVCYRNFGTDCCVHSHANVGKSLIHHTVSHAGSHTVTAIGYSYFTN